MAWQGSARSAEWMAGLEGSLVVALKDLILDFSEYDVNHVVADIEEIRRYNPQRFEMEQLTAIVYDDVENGIGIVRRHTATDQGRQARRLPDRPDVIEIGSMAWPSGRIAQAPARSFEVMMMGETPSPPRAGREAASSSSSRGSASTQVWPLTKRPGKSRNR